MGELTTNTRPSGAVRRSAAGEFGSSTCSRILGGKKLIHAGSQKARMHIPPTQMTSFFGRSFVAACHSRYIFIAMMAKNTTQNTKGKANEGSIGHFLNHAR